MKSLTKRDLWYSVIGGAALSTGGGGASVSYEQFSEAIDPVIQSECKLNLIDAASVPDEELVFISAGVGGGLERELSEKYMRRFTSVQDWINEMDRIYPLPSWAKKPDDDWLMMPHKKMVELKGKEAFAYMPFEIGPNNYREFLRAGMLGIPVIDADNAGFRAVPELSLATLNVINAPIAPAVTCTTWGDMAIFEKFLSWQRAEDLIRHMAITSGGGCSGMLCFSGQWIKKGVVDGSLSLSMRVGKAIMNAREKKHDPVEAIINATKGYVLFRGEIAGYTNEGKGAFTWGNAWIKGTDAYEGKTYRLWYKNENQISWVNDVPYVTCPDPFTVVDSDTGEGLSNFTAASWNQGRKVTVWGMKSASLWRTPRGLKIYNPKHFGFDIEYRPIENITKN